MTYATDVRTKNYPDQTSMPKWVNPVLYLKYRTVYEASVNQVGTKVEDALEIKWKPGGD